MKNGIGVIVNPFSRQNKRNPDRINKLAYIVGSRGTIAATKNLSELEEVAVEFKKSRYLPSLEGMEPTILRLPSL